MLAVAAAALAGTQWIAAASPDEAPDVGRALNPDAIFSRAADGAYICTLDAVRRVPQRCPPFGPGTRQLRIAYLSALLPKPLPALPVQVLPAPEGSVTRFVYGRIIDLPAPTYRHPAEAAAALPPLRVFQSNINWVSVIGTVEYEGQQWVQINGDEYIEAGHIDYPEASRFQGVQMAAQPSYPFAWLRWEIRPATEPGGQPDGDSLPRRTLVTVFATETVGGRRWDMVGPGQWVDHDGLSQVMLRATPDGVPAGAKWIDVDTYEQTLAAYEGDRMVYATLITAGKSDLTPLGLFRIFRKVRAALMQSYDRPMDDEYWFHLEDVEHAQFFNDRISLHAAYWHDYFGTSRSNGCVNLAPLDARWLYGWTDPQIGPGESWVTAEATNAGTTWVWVHHSGDGVTHKPRQ
jgi:hypothetical protein